MECVENRKTSITLIMGV